MSLESQIQVQLFGAFREFYADGVLVLPKLQSETVSQLKVRIQNQLASARPATFDVALLVEKSVLATDQKILSHNDKIEISKISILPPVCGG